VKVEKIIFFAETKYGAGIKVQLLDGNAAPHCKLMRITFNVTCMRFYLFRVFLLFGVSELMAISGASSSLSKSSISLARESYREDGYLYSVVLDSL
jgi:hypothetical protein